MNTTRRTARFAVRFISAGILAGISLATLAQAQQLAAKKRLTVTCYWQNNAETVLSHLQNRPTSTGCEKYKDPTHCLRTAGEMLLDTNHDWERVTAEGLIYTISCKKNCKMIPAAGPQTFDAETDGKQMWITFEKANGKNLVGTFEIVDISPMKEDTAAQTQSGESTGRPQQPSAPASGSELSSADFEVLSKLMELEPPDFCAASPLLAKAFVAAMGGWKSSFDGMPLSEKTQFDFVFQATEGKLWKCSHAAAMQNDPSSFQQNLFALVLVEQTHLTLRQSALDNAVDSMVVLSTAAPAPTPSVGQRIQAGIQGAAQALNQWAEYQRQLRLARTQNQFHCTTRTWGNTTYTDCY